MAMHWETKRSIDTNSPVRLHKPHDGEGECMKILHTFNDYLLHEIEFFGFGRMENFTLFPAYSHPDVPADESVIMEFIDPKGQSLFFTTRGLTIPGHGFIHYKDIGHSDWPHHVKGLEHDFEEYIAISGRDIPTITFHLGKRASVPLGGFIMLITRTLKNMQAKQSRADSPG
jgi:hypothetical protein